ncbi:MAG: hypothetical protein ACM336_15740 [Acidobacteriota bacterium]
MSIKTRDSILISGFRLLIASIAVLGSARAVILDRIAVTVGNDVITETEVNDEIRVTAFINGEPLDFSPASRRQAAERLVDQVLIRRDMQLSNWPQPESSEADKLLAQLKRQRFGSNAQYRQALARYGIKEVELKQHLLWQLAALRYTDYRFQPGIPQPDENLRAYLEEQTRARSAANARRAATAATHGQFHAGARTTHPRTDEVGSPPPAEKLGSAAPQDSNQRSIDEQMDAWLKDARSRTRIVYHEDAFR